MKRYGSTVGVTLFTNQVICLKALFPILESVQTFDSGITLLTDTMDVRISGSKMFLPFLDYSTRKISK